MNRAPMAGRRAQSIPMNGVPWRRGRGPYTPASIQLAARRPCPRTRSSSARARPPCVPSSNQLSPTSDTRPPRSARRPMPWPPCADASSTSSLPRASPPPAPSPRCAPPARDGITPILVVSPANDVEAQIAFLEAGADDVIVGGFAHSELEGRVMAQLIRTGKVRPDSPAHSGNAEIVAFFSPKGGVGTTTLAVNTAVLLAGGATPIRRRATAPGCRSAAVARPAGRPGSSVRPGGDPPQPHPPLRHRRACQRRAGARRSGAGAHVPDDPLVRAGRARRAHPARGRLPRERRAPRANLRPDAHVLRSHHRRPRQPPGPARGLAARAGRCAHLRPLPGDRGAPRHEHADELPGGDDAAAGA